jgi:cytidylate kinase
MDKVPVITIDGPSGSGKGTLAQRIATTLGWRLLDSGAIYRVLGLVVDRVGISDKDVDKIVKHALNLPVSFGRGKVFLKGEDVSVEIRTEGVGDIASRVAAIPEVRQALLAWQRGYAKSPGLVADGRDMGTVVFPEAQVKIFLTASVEERALRRYKQLKEKGLSVNLAVLTEEIEARDVRDSNRATAPLKAAETALCLDSTGVSAEGVYHKVMQEINMFIPGLPSRPHFS